MREPLTTIAAVIPGLLAVIAVAAFARAQPTVRSLIAPVVDRAEDTLAAEKEWKARRRLSLLIARAGWSETPERVVVFALAAGVALGALGMSASFVLGAAAGTSLAFAGVAAGLGAVAFTIRSAIVARRRRLLRELAPLLELFVLELGGGGSALSALGSVTMQIEGELAAEIRRLLIASHVSGSPSFETRLRVYAETLALPPLNNLATILVASREYGTPVTQGVRALAADLRRGQRRELIAHSRRALNHVLFPAAIGVLLPFLAVLLYPAVTSLEANLR
jgi:tight adherence protein C